MNSDSDSDVEAELDSASAQTTSAPADDTSCPPPRSPDSTFSPTARTASGAPKVSPTQRDRTKPRLNDLSGKDWIKSTKSWFICDSPRYHRNRETELHPARFPEELATEFIRFFTQAGDWVLDPFCGSGATLVAAREEGRHAVGVELSPRYAEVARRRLAQSPGKTEALVIQGDARKTASLIVPPPLPGEGAGGGADCTGETPAPPLFDFLLTSPPYWDMLRHPRGGVKSKHQQRIEQGLDREYSQDPADLGNIRDYDDFIESLGGIFDSLSTLLRAQRYLVVVVQNLRVPHGEVKPLAWDLARRVSRTYSFQGERIWCQNSKPLGIWGYPTTFVPNYHHHYCLVFRKP